MTRASSQRRSRRQNRDTITAVRAKLDRARSGKDHPNPDRLGRQMIERAWSVAHRRANQCLGASVRRLFTLEILPDGAEFATIDCAHSPYTVRISAGLPGFVYRIARLLAARSAPFNDDSSPTATGDADTMSYEESAERINRAFFWYSAARGSTIHQNFPITDDQAILGGFIASEAEIFLMSHEIAHGLLAGLASDANGFTKELGAGLEDMPDDWREEFMADRLALLLALGSRTKPRSGREIAWQYAGWEFALLLHREWERVDSNCASSAAGTATHPPASDRVENLRGTLRRCIGANDAGNILSCAESFSTVFRGLVDTILSDDFRAALIVRDEIRVTRLMALAEACGTTVVPDYARYVPEAGAILMEAESWTLLQLVNDATAAIRGETEIDEMNFAIAKLVWRTCEDLPEPAYSVLKKVTELPDLR